MSSRNEWYRIRKPDTFALGIACLAFAALILWQGRSLPLGAPSTPGHGFFPFVLGIIVASLSVLCIGSAFIGEREVEQRQFSLRGPFFVLLAPLLFAFTIERLGLITAILAVVLVSSAARQFKWKSTVVLAVVLAAACAGLFIYALDLPLPLLWKR